MKKISLKSLSLLCFIVAILISCKKDIYNKDLKHNKDNSIITFNKDEIPYTPEEFQRAVKLLLTNQNYKTSQSSTSNINANNITPFPNVPPPTANYNYVRIKPADEDQMFLLTEGGCNFELYEEPLHLEDFEYTGDDYEDPAIPADQYPWFYTCVPIGYSIPSGIQYEIIQPLFLYNDDINEPADIEDSWGGEVEDKPDNTNSSSARNINIQSVAEWMLQSGNPMEKATKWIQNTYPNLNLQQIKNIAVTAKLKCPVDPCSPDFPLYANNPIYTCAGLTCPTQGGGGSNTGCNALQDSYRPKGNLKVKNTSSLTNDALKGVKIRCRNGFKLGKSYTDINGNFECNKTYQPNKKVRVIVKFKNPNTKVRASMSNGRFWQFWFPVKHKFDKKKNCDLETITYIFQNDGNNSSKTTRKWSAATYLTAHYDMKNYCTQEGIIPPNKTKVWMTNGKKGLRAFTPMLNYTLSWATGSPKLNLLSVAVDATLIGIPFFGPILIVLKKIVELSKPDVMIPISNNSTIYNSEDLYNTVFHELSHAVHFKTMGYNGWTSASNYWVDNGIYLIDHSNDCSQYNNGYGCKASAGSERTALIEGWAYFAGNTFTSKFFEGKFNLIRDNELKQIEYQTPTNTDDVTGIYSSSTASTGWIPFGLFNDLRDAYKADDIIVNPNNASDVGVDNVSGYTMQKLINALPSGTNSVQAFKQNLLNNSGQPQAADVNNLVRRYGY